MRRSTARIAAAGPPAVWLGANFWSRAGGPLMWRTYDPAVIRAELGVLAAHGLTMTRSFFYWPDFMPGPGTIDEEMAARFADFLDRHAEQHLVTVPTFIVGHMSGQNWDPPWRAGRDLLSDVWLVGRQAWFAGEMVRRFAGHPAVAGWLVSNEMPLYGSERTPPETVAAVLHHSLLAGATGWIAWNNTDFDLPGQDPYRHHAFEQRFGLTDAAGGPKPALAEMRAFAATLRAIDARRCARAEVDTALIVPAYLDTAYPFTDPADGPRIARTLAQAYVCARLADLPPALVRESAGLPGGARLYLAPSVKQLLAPTAAALERLAAGGACVYLSYSAGDTPRHPGPWYGRLDAVFGVRHQLDVGLASPIEDQAAVLRLHRDFGGLAAGATLSFAVAGEEYSRSFLPVEPDGAEVIAADQRGRPALLLRRIGRGSLVLGTYPVEQMAALTPRVNPDDAVSLYRALAAHARVRRAVSVDHPRVACDALVREDGTIFAALASHDAGPLTVRPALDDTQIAGAVTLDPFGTKIFTVTGPRFPDSSPAG